MEPRDIPIHPVDALTIPETREIRENAPTLLLSLIENGKLENVDSIQDLPERSLRPLAGRASACYFLTDNAQPRVIKFRYSGVEAEAQALSLWQTHDVSVPDVYAAGVVPTTVQTKRLSKYIIMEGIVDTEGKPAPTGNQYALAHPEALPALGRLIGAELAKIHAISTSLPFGSFSDMGKPEDTVSTLKELFTNNLARERLYLHTLGIAEDQIHTLQEAIHEIDFPDQGVCIHGDPGLHNILIASEEPLEIKVFDPNPKIHDPYWDLARMSIRQAVIEEYAREHPEDAEFAETSQKEKAFIDTAMAVYWTNSGRKYDEKRMLVNEIFRGIGPLRRYQKSDAETVPLGFMRKEIPRDTAVDLRKKVLAKQIQKLAELQNARRDSAE